MKAVIQRVSSASITINSNINRVINKGLVVLIAVTHDDSVQDVIWLVNKIINLRIFSDKELKMNLSLLDVKGDIMIVSQFTLYASTRKGNRPSFIDSAKTEIALALYNEFVKKIIESVPNSSNIATGEFGADMQVTLTNDGPVTIIIDTQQKY